MKLLTWFKTLRAIVATHDADLTTLRRRMDDLARLRDRMDDLDRLVRERTDIAVDVAYQGPDRTHVIVVGRYRNRDYVQTYSYQPEDFLGLMERLRDMERHGIVRQLDGPPMVKAVFERERRDRT